MPSGGETEAEEQRRKKGKGKEVERKTKWTLLGKDARCTGCIGKALDVCRVDLAAVERWEADLAGGKVFTRAPVGTACDTCRQLKHRCQLPQAVMMLEVLEEAAAEAKKGERKGEEAEEE